MKWLIILGLFAIVLALIGLRFRRQIKMAIDVWQMFRQMRQMGKADERQIEKKSETKAVQLVRCAKCGTWIEQDKALKLPGGLFYCSKNCLETMARSG